MLSRFQVPVSGFLRTIFDFLLLRLLLPPSPCRLGRRRHGCDRGAGGEAEHLASHVGHPEGAETTKDCLEQGFLNAGNHSKKEQKCFLMLFYFFFPQGNYPKKKILVFCTANLYG